MNHRRRAAGFTMVEIMIAMSIAVLVLGATWLVVSGVIQNDDALRARVDMQLECTRGLKSMVELLKQSGVVEADGNWVTQPIASADADDEYPKIYTLGTTATDFVNPAIFSTTGYLNFNHFAQGAYEAGSPPSHVINTCVQYPNLVDVEGLGGSNGILFRVAKDSDHPDITRGMAVTKGSTVNGDITIEWGGEYHAITVVRNNVEGYNELVHLVWDQNKQPKSKTVLANYVSRLIIEVKGLPANPPPVWPLPSGRAMDTGESQAAYTAALTQPYPPPPTSAFEIRVTLCLAKPSLNNQENSLTKKDRLKVVWQQANVNMRSVQR
jgi:prepilin-type N-terminal cleavage/methylation domain-containing protein